MFVYKILKKIYKLLRLYKIRYSISNFKNAYVELKFFHRLKKNKKYKFLWLKFKFRISNLKYSLIVNSNNFKTVIVLNKIQNPKIEVYCNENLLKL